jgi:phosphoesterase RecJ-like protein
VEVAILAYEINTMEFKVSMRSNSYVDVSKIAAYFNGGGHIRAAGCTIRGTLIDVINNLLRHIEPQLKGNENV